MRGMIAKIRVVIADDEEMYRKALRRTIEPSPDIELVASCKDGNEGYERWCELRPDVMLVDLVMPHMSGIELIERVVAHDRNCRVVVLTVQENDESILEAFRSGASGYLLKTSTPQDVLESIRYAHRGEAKITPRVAAHIIAELRNQAQGSHRLTETVALSVREQQILAFISEGLRNREIADRLEIAEKTVKNHVSSILKTLQVTTRTEAALKAVRTKLVSTPHGR